MLFFQGSDYIVDSLIPGVRNVEERGCSHVEVGDMEKHSQYQSPVSVGHIHHPGYLENNKQNRIRKRCRLRDDSSSRSPSHSHSSSRSYSSYSSSGSSTSGSRSHSSSSASQSSYSSYTRYGLKYVFCLHSALVLCLYCIQKAMYLYQ